MASDPSAPPTRLAVPPFRAAIFDMDGLLIDSERPIRDAFLAACLANGLSITPQAYAQVIGRNRHDTDQLLGRMIGDPMRYRRIVAQTMVDIEALHEAGGFALKPGARALLEALSASGIALGVASSSRLGHIEERLRMAGVLGYFDALAGGDEVSKGKPAPDLFLLAAQRLARSAQQCLVFEDSRAGAGGALAAGMAVVVVPDLQQPDERIRADSLAVLDGLDQVLERLSDWFGAR